MKSTLISILAAALLIAGCSAPESPVSLPAHLPEVYMVKVYEGSGIVDTVRGKTVSIGMSHQAIVSVLGAAITGSSEEYEPVAASITQEYYRMAGGVIRVTFTSSSRTGAAGVEYLSDNFMTVNGKITYWKKTADLVRAYGRQPDDTTGGTAFYLKEGVAFSIDRELDRITRVMILTAQSSGSGGNPPDTSSQSPTEPSSSATLKAYYALDGNAADSLGTGGGTLHGTTPAADRFGASGRALNFNGTRDWVEVPRQTASRLSISVWIHPAPVGYASFSSGSYVVVECADTTRAPANGDYWISLINESGDSSRFAVDFGARDASGSARHAATSQAYPFNQWHHIAWVNDSASIKLYVNGTLASSVPFSGQRRTQANVLGIGDDCPAGSDHPFRGRIDEVRIYGSALSPAEISALSAKRP